MIVAGVMSGTSADGIDVAITRITGGVNLKFQLLRHEHFAYPRAVREAVLQTMNAQTAGVADLSRLNFLLGELYAQSIQQAQRNARQKIELIGCHGQTIYHQGEPQNFLGKQIACTWQTGEAAVIAERLHVPVVSDFRPADLAAGGKGAPLVPFLDYVLFRQPLHVNGRIVQNIGGIANLTAIPGSARAHQVIAFDTGPGNMVIDQLMQVLFEQPYDRNGKVAADGKILQPVLKELLRNPFFSKKPPKSAGREEFGREFAADFIRQCGRSAKADVIATATALTVFSITQAIRKFVLPGGRYRDFIISGGGTANRTMMTALEQESAKLGLKMRRADEFGIPSQAKEAIAFALLAYETWHHRPGNIPSATGASRPVILGKVSYV